MARRTLASLVLALLCVAASGCLLPVRSAPGVEGRVVEAGSRRPLAGALVVVRFDGRHGNLLPDREKLGHVELRTGADGRFQIPRHFSPGVALWPYFEGEARVLSVLADGYRCSSPQKVAPGVAVELALAAAADRRDQRASCRPVAARPGEAAAYMASWRALFDEPDSDQALEDRRRVEQILVARTALGFADNCEGPVLDLALSPDGRMAAIAQRERQGTAVHVVDLTPGGGTRGRRVGAAERMPPRRLAWTSPHQLVAWVPTATPLREAATARGADGRVEVLWNAPAEERASSAPRRALATPVGSIRPLEPEDVYDEGANRWAGRGFTLVQGVDAATGLAREQLRIVAPDGTRHEIELPGEPCGPTGQFGQPQYRIAADGSHAVDLRFVGGACRAVSIDLASGAWYAIDAAGRGRAECRNERRIPPSHLRVALRGYLRQAENSLASAGADPTRSYLLRIEPSGAAQAETRDASGHTQHVALAPFPVATPLRIVHVTNVAPVDGMQPAPKTAPKPAPPDDDEQGLEPL